MKILRAICGVALLAATMLGLRAFARIPQSTIDQMCFDARETEEGRE